MVEEPHDISADKPRLRIMDTLAIFETVVLQPGWSCEVWNNQNSPLTEALGFPGPVPRIVPRNNAL